MSRPDGRANAATLRPLSCELSCLQRPDGSALWKSGSTHVLCAVYGPVAPQNPALETDTESMVSVVIKSGNLGNTDYLENELSEFLTQVLSACIDTTLFPRCVIEVVLQIIQSDGSLLASLLHASVAALMDAGVDLLYLPVATTCLVAKNSQILLDPSEAEEQAEPTLLCLVNPHDKPDKVLASHTVGSGTSLEDLLKCLQISQKACSAIPAFWRLAMEQKVNRESQTLWSR
mmetsp:Transcript_645/g.1476  ORF Transcript_645/g.1476 Transcript_645/m.1476 type:complete len:232 (-) Transcript_645:80-775(-)